MKEVSKNQTVGYKGIEMGMNEDILMSEGVRKDALVSPRYQGVYRRLGEKCTKEMTMIEETLARRNIVEFHTPIGDNKTTVFHFDKNGSRVEGVIPITTVFYDEYARFEANKVKGMQSTFFEVTFGKKGSDVHTGEMFDRVTGKVCFTYLDGKVLITYTKDEAAIQKEADEKAHAVQRMVLEQKQKNQ